MLARTSTDRTMMASRSTAIASPIPTCWKGTQRAHAKPPNTATMISAAPVMMAAVVRSP
ncbi:MAG TPA: hypothetical protein VLD86_06875 [Ilumatobacteraceae bacterium]|nr:hypothetical protein [Ilumatobacteraceae bacterium]